MIAAGVNLIPDAPVGRMTELARQAERLGYGRCWVYDEGLATRDPYVTLTAIALATERLEVGPGITNPYTRHPAQTAAAIASLDEASGGRAFLGIGAGGSLTLDPLGLERLRPVDAVREAIEVCRALFTGGVVDYQGGFVTLREARMGYARADVPIWLAGRGPRMLELGGASADGVMLDFIHKDTMGEYLDRVRKGGERTGNRPRICYSTMIVTESDSLDDVKPHLTYRLVDSPPRVRELLGLAQADVDRIRSALAGGHQAAARHVRDEWVLPFVIAGRPEECAGELAGLMAAHGLHEFLLPVLDPHTADGYMERAAGVLRMG